MPPSVVDEFVREQWLEIPCDAPLWIVGRSADLEFDDAIGLYIEHACVIHACLGWLHGRVVAMLVAVQEQTRSKLLDEPVECAETGVGVIRAVVHAEDGRVRHHDIDAPAAP